MPRSTAVLVLAVAGLALVGCDSGSAALTLPAPRHVVTGPSVSGGRDYTFDLLTGATTVRVQAADLGGHLYRISTPTGAAIYPVADVSPSHTVQVSLRGGGDGDVTVELDRSAAWTVRFSAGMSVASVDMTGGTLSGLTALGGVSTLDVTAGRPRSPVTLSELAGLSTFALHIPAATPVAVHLTSGAGTVSLFGLTHQGIAAGTTLSSAGDPAAPGYTIGAQGGAGAVVVDAR